MASVRNTAGAEFAPAEVSIQAMSIILGFVTALIIAGILCYRMGR
jgi:hypothetical protein